MEGAGRRSNGLASGDRPISSDSIRFATAVSGSARTAKIAATTVPDWFWLALSTVERADFYSLETHTPWFAA